MCQLTPVSPKTCDRQHRASTAGSGREFEAGIEKLINGNLSMSFGVLGALPKARRTVGDTAPPRNALHHGGCE